MSEHSSSRPGDPLEDLRGRLDARRPELEETALTRITAIGDTARVADPSYVVGLREALGAALDYGLGTVERGEGGEIPPIPLPLFSQARSAARAGVSLETVLRRYAAGHSLLVDSLLDEAAGAGLSSAALKRTLNGLAARYDRIVAAVSEEYERETASQPGGSERRRQALLRRLLAGEPADPEPLGYGFDCYHLAIVAFGASFRGELQQLGERVDRRLLVAEADPQTAWVWLGGRRQFGREELDSIAEFAWPAGSALAFGEPGRGLAGWRLSHRQAATALPVARRVKRSVVRYADVALLAAALQDDLLATSLRHVYLIPLEAGREAGRITKSTLRAYFAAARNVSSAAAALGVSRRTVAHRIATAEERLGRSLNVIAAELDLALRLEEIEDRKADVAHSDDRPVERA